MYKSKIYKFILLFFFSISLASCAFLNTETNSNATAGNAANEQSKNADNKTISSDKSNETSGLCENEYYPIDTAKSREYKISGGAPANYVLMQNKPNENSFTEKRKYESEMDLTVNWICTEEGLRTAEYNNTANLSKANFKMETLESSGITLPKTWEVGKKWTAEYKISAKLNAGAASGGANGTVKINNEIVSLDDKITTAAGDFTAAKVVSDLKMNLNISKPITMKMTNWYAPNVGLIKQTVDSPFGKDVTVEYTGEK